MSGRMDAPCPTCSDQRHYPTSSGWGHSRGVCACVTLLTDIERLQFVVPSYMCESGQSAVPFSTQTISDLETNTPPGDRRKHDGFTIAPYRGRLASVSLYSVNATPAQVEQRESFPQLAITTPSGLGHYLQCFYVSYNSTCDHPPRISQRSSG